MQTQVVGAIAEGAFVGPDDESMSGRVDQRRNHNDD